MNKERLLEVLRSEMAPALGVTEPAAIALAAAKAYQSIGGNLEAVELTLDPGIFKNAYSCAVPGTGDKGIEIAAILGVLAGEPEAELEVLKDIREEDVRKAKSLRDKDIVQINIKEGISSIFVEAVVVTDKGTARVIIKDLHANIVHVEVNGKVVYTKNNKEEMDDNSSDYNLPAIDMEEILNLIENLSFEEIRFTMEAVKKNKELAESGKDGEGMKVGYGFSKLMKEKMLADDLAGQAKMLTAYAVDARMGGVPLPAMSFCGSGDHGIIATLPLVAVAERENFSQEKLAKSIIISYIITLYLKNLTGKLSAYCGCAVAARTGAAAGVAYLLGGDKEQIIGAINNMAGNITGMICDGGNFGCALKATTAAGAAVEAALLANNNYYLENKNGIVGKDLKETLDNMALIATPGMEKTNDTIIDILQK